jgi:prepilin signal peptidase PulO-like enzyme (type II secretory pathway)
LVALLSATSVAAAISMWLVFRGRARLSSAIPLGPYLLLGLLVSVVWLCAQPGGLTPA